MEHRFKKADITDLPLIWDILEQAIIRRKDDGSNQWQDGYPNPGIIKKDIERGAGYVLTDNNNNIVGYCAVFTNDEPEYEKIQGKWLTDGDFLVFHRLAIGTNYLGLGLAGKILGFIEDMAKGNNIFSIKADTNFDNLAMLRIFGKAGYVYCGEVFFRGSPRKAFEKALEKAIE